MYTSETTIRVRYGETDQMGYVYYGNYAQYCEIARVECCRSLGISYKQIEGMGTLMPVLEHRSTFIAPAGYDDLIRIVTTIPEKPKARIRFAYKFYNEDNLLIHEGETVLGFVDKVRKKPCKLPQALQDLLLPHFS